jgi:hypothetical protein
MNENEIVDVLVGISNHNFIVQQRTFPKGSIEAEEAKQTMVILAYKGMKEGYGIYRQNGNSFTELHPEVDYPRIIELEKIFESSEKSTSIGKK